MSRFFQLDTDDPGHHWYPTEGWGIFNVGDAHPPQFEVQRIDELQVLPSDDEAIPLAMKKGYVLSMGDNPYAVVGQWRIKN